MRSFREQLANAQSNEELGMTEHIERPVDIGIDEIELGELVQAIRRNGRLIAACVMMALVAALLYLHTAAYQHSITLQVTPANGNSGNRVSGQLGGLASLAGVSLPTNPAQASFDLYLEGLTSRQAAEALAKNPEIMQHIFVQEWDAERERWIAPHGLLPAMKHMIQSIIGPPPQRWSPPNSARFQLFLSKNVKILRNKESPIVTVSILSADPQFGIKLLKALHTAVDGLLRRRALERASVYVQYLRGQLQLVNVAEYRMALTEALAEQEKMRMMASSTLPFAAEPFGDPVASVKPVSPNPVFVLGIALFAGFAVGALIALIRHWAGRGKHESVADPHLTG